MTSRERLLSALDGADGAPAPCSFMMFRALRSKCRNEYEFATRQAEMGIAARLRLDDLPIRFSPEVKITDSITPGPDGDPPIITRVYETPAGPLTSSIKQVEGWPFGDHLPLFSDFITPRAVQHPISAPEHLPALRYLLTPPHPDDVTAFAEEAARRKRFAQERDFALAGGWRGERDIPSEDRSLVGAEYGTGCLIDTLMWLCGGTEPLLWAYDQPDFLRELIALVEEWDRARLQIHLEAGVDLVFHRAWYEGTDFWSPTLFRDFIHPAIRRDVEITHQAGARYAYIITTGMMPVADFLVEAGVDAVVGIDPGMGKGTTLANVRDKLGGKTCLWGGVSGPLTVEEGTEADVRAAVEATMSILGETGRFILSPVDNIRADTDHSWHNVQVVIDTWRQIAGAA
ncbi:MAG: uroporphyrinogen decarboxylase family protein [Armatimonadetes bacterium]|nr:uroporphyrinogen decarboxylase family protein [Armatimonadota bacterium]